MDSIEQHGSVVSLAMRKALNRSLLAAAGWTGVQYIGSTTPITKTQELASALCMELCTEHMREDNARRASMRFYLSSVGVVSAGGGA